MNPSHDLEPRIADYYATEAPSRAPDWLLARALDTIDTTPQRRTRLGRPWRIPPLSPFAKLAVGGHRRSSPTHLAAPSIGPAATGVGQPQRRHSPPPLTERFDSTFNGISMDYPAGWQTRPATEPWTSRALTFDEPGADIIFDPTLGEDLYLAMASEAIRGRANEGGRGVTLPSCPGGHGGGFLTFDGASGWVGQCGGRPVLRHSAVLKTDTHGYAIVLYVGDKGLADTYDWPYFRSILETLDLRAEDAPGASNASEAP